MRYFHLLGKQCVSLGDVNIEEVCLYLVSDVVHLIFLRHKMDLRTVETDPCCGANKSLRGGGSKGAFSVSLLCRAELIPP